jgi:hypothetical protein
MDDSSRNHLFFAILEVISAQTNERRTLKETIKEMHYLQSPKSTPTMELIVKKDETDQGGEFMMLIPWENQTLFALVQDTSASYRVEVIGKFDQSLL